MNRQDAETTLTEYLKPIFGFALKRCKSLQDAEDLSQEIAAKAFRAFLLRDDVENTDKFIWTIAHNALSNYYRNTSKGMTGVSLDEVAELLADPHSEIEPDDTAETLGHLRTEIAYLSKLQRKIVIAYYFENRRQSEIANDLGIPLGTVKWHLFEAKKELKRGMDTMRNMTDLKFNPISFSSYGINGSAGTKSPEEFFRSALSQNICYCIRNSAKTVNEIADILGVSPVYVESEVEFLEEYGFLLERAGKYIANFIINEPSPELLTLQNQVYKHAAKLYANALYEELTSNGILDHPDILCNQSDSPVVLTKTPRADANFLLWALIPYITAWSGEKLMREEITFEEVATIRPDGGHNIFHAYILPTNSQLPEDYISMDGWCGPMWNGDGKKMLWQIDSKWSDRIPAGERNAFEEHRKILSLANYEEEAPLSKLDYAWLAERGYIKTNGDFDGYFKSVWQIVILNGTEIRDKLLTIGENIKKKYWKEFEVLQAPYIDSVLQSIPAHLRKVKAFELQFMFHSDGLFLAHCIQELVENGKLKEPTEGQRKVLSTVMVEV